uniref:Putative secreted protein n=1 Tax=Anopheles darlingi TaxID=43151 RepID=A0A2M4DIC4_ANODA
MCSFFRFTFLTTRALAIARNRAPSLLIPLEGVHFPRLSPVVKYQIVFWQHSPRTSATGDSSVCTSSFLLDLLPFSF